jgi:hypothetical protein
VSERRALILLLCGFLACDLLALALLGPVSPADNAADVARLYSERAGMVLASRFVQCLGLIVAFWLLALLLEQVRVRGGSDTVVRVAYGGLVALVPIEIVRNVMMAALALRYDDFGAAALPVHVVAVLLGPAIAFPVAAALSALAWHFRSRLLAVLAAAWVASGIRIVTTSTVIWYGGLVAFAGLIVALVVLALDVARRPIATVPAS